MNLCEEGCSAELNRSLVRNKTISRASNLEENIWCENSLPLFFISVLISWVGKFTADAGGNAFRAFVFVILGNRFSVFGMFL